MPKQDLTHACPIPGCTHTGLPFAILMCPFHWRWVPPALQERVNLAWNRGAPRPDYSEARAAAIDAVVRRTGAK